MSRGCRHILEAVQLRSLATHSLRRRKRIRSRDRLGKAHTVAGPFKIGYDYWLYEVVRSRSLQKMLAEVSTAIAHKLTREGRHAAEAAFVKEWTARWSPQTDCNSGHVAGLQAAPWVRGRGSRAAVGLKAPARPRNMPRPGPSMRAWVLGKPFKAKAQPSVHPNRSRPPTKRETRVDWPTVREIIPSLLD